MKFFPMVFTKLMTFLPILEQRELSHAPLLPYCVPKLLMLYCQIKELNQDKGLSIAYLVVLLFSEGNCPGTNGHSYHRLNSGTGSVSVPQRKVTLGFPSSHNIQLTPVVEKVFLVKASCSIQLHQRKKPSSQVMPFWHLHSSLWDII